MREQLDLSQHGGLAKPHASRVTLKQINSWYEGGRPSNRIQSAGVLIHTRDNTEQQGGPWKLPFPGERQFQNFWATSIVNKDLPGLYSYTCGLVLDPAFANVLCSYHTDFTSWNGGCNRTGLSSLSWDMPNKQDTPYPPDQLEDMMNMSRRRSGSTDQHADHHDQGKASMRGCTPVCAIVELESYTGCVERIINILGGMLHHTDSAWHRRAYMQPMTSGLDQHCS